VADRFVFGAIGKGALLAPVCGHSHRGQGDDRRCGSSRQNMRNESGTGFGLARDHFGKAEDSE
jgi:hypothetical protein